MKIDKSTYEQLKSYLEIARDDNSIEFETLFYPNKINREQFDRLISILKKKCSMQEHSEVLDIVNIEHNYSHRITLIGLPNISKYCKTNKLIEGEYTVYKKTKFIKKLNNKAEPINLKEYSIKINLKTEEQLLNYQKSIEKLGKQQKTFRLKKRYSFQISDLFRFDLTIVKSSKKENHKYIPSNNLKNSGVLTNNPEFEVELEFTGDKQNTQDINSIIEEMFTYITFALQPLQDTDCIISKNQINDISKKYLQLAYPDLSEKDKGYFNKKKFIGPKPITLEMSNIRTVESDSNLTSIRNGYSVTDKADGERNLLFIDDLGDLYLINQKMEIKYTGISSPELSNSIFDGEYIKYNKEGLPLDRNKFAIFDIYFYKNEDTRNRILSNPNVITANNEYSKLYSDLPDGRYQLLEKIFENKSLFTNKNVNNPMLIFKKKFEFVHSDKKNSIFEKSKIILQNSKLNDYYIDGLIFTPIKYGVAQDIEGEQKIIKDSGKTWKKTFKWKPPEDNSIDFKIDIIQEKSNSGKMIDKIEFEYNSGKLKQYKTAILKVGLDKSDKASYLTCRDLYTEKSQNVLTDKKFENVPFNPTKPYDKKAHLAKLYLSDDNNARCTKDGSLIQKDNIVEFIYHIDNNNWEPLRTRYDKTEGNYFKTANSVWASMHNPITYENITTGNDLPSVDEEEEIYFAGDKSNIQYDKYTKNQRNFHNLYIKNKLIVGVSEKNGKQTMLELGCGKGQDISRWCYANLALVIGIDNSKNAIEDSIDGACVRYNNYINSEKCENPPNAIFIYGDCNKNIESGDAGNNEENKMLLKTLWGSIDKKDINDDDMKPLWGKVSNKFDIISCQFSIHYMLINEDGSINTEFIKNISDNLKDNGFFIGTTFDGEKVFKKLESLNNEDFVSRSKDNILIWKLTKKYSHSKFEKDLNYPIDVYYGSIGKTNKEYLVNFNILKDSLEKYDIKLVNDSEAKKIGFDKATGTFDELFNKSDKAKLMSDIESEYSGLNRWFIFKKNKSKSSKKIILTKKK